MYLRSWLDAWSRLFDVWVQKFKQIFSIGSNNHNNNCGSNPRAHHSLRDPRGPSTRGQPKLLHDHYPRPSIPAKALPPRHHAGHKDAHNGWEPPRNPGRHLQAQQDVRANGNLWKGSAQVCQRKWRWLWDWELCCLYSASIPPSRTG